MNNPISEKWNKYLAIENISLKIVPFYYDKFLKRFFVPMHLLSYFVDVCPEKITIMVIE